MVDHILQPVIRLCSIHRAPFHWKRLLSPSLSFLSQKYFIIDGTDWQTKSFFPVVLPCWPSLRGDTITQHFPGLSRWSPCKTLDIQFWFAIVRVITRVIDVTLHYPALVWRLELAIRGHYWPWTNIPTTSPLLFPSSSLSSQSSESETGERLYSRGGPPPSYLLLFSFWHRVFEVLLFSPFLFYFHPEVVRLAGPSGYYLFLASFFSTPHQKNKKEKNKIKTAYK